VAPRAIVELSTTVAHVLAVALSYQLKASVTRGCTRHTKLKLTKCLLHSCVAGEVSPSRAYGPPLVAVMPGGEGPTK
jgi:hypothetical protein